MPCPAVFSTASSAERAAISTAPATSVAAAVVVGAKPVMTVQTHHPAHRPNRQTLYVAIALVLGIVMGELLNLTPAGTGQPNTLLAQIIAVLAVQLAQHPSSSIK